MIEMLNVPRHCGKCDYELTGLPPVGKCPECGNRYNLRSDEGTREDRLAYDRGNRLFSMLVTWSMFGIAGFVLLAGFAAAIIRRAGGGGDEGIFTSPCVCIASAIALFFFAYGIIRVLPDRDGDG